MRIFYKNNQMRITNITINTKIGIYLQSLWNQNKTKNTLFAIGYKKSNSQKTKYILIILTKCLAE